jgi:hypothetical protein
VTAASGPLRCWAGGGLAPWTSEVPWLAVRALVQRTVEVPWLAVRALVQRTVEVPWRLAVEGLVHRTVGLASIRAGGGPVLGTAGSST